MAGRSPAILTEGQDKRGRQGVVLSSTTVGRGGLKTLVSSSPEGAASVVGLVADVSGASPRRACARLRRRCAARDPARSCRRARGRRPQRTSEGRACEARARHVRAGAGPGHSGGAGLAHDRRRASCRESRSTARRILPALRL